jgi:hypothetical protein
MAADTKAVMAGLVPAIHAAKLLVDSSKRLDRKRSPCNPMAA